MADFTERHFSIDAGMGTKMEGCPYSLYEDGRDVEEYIVPPKGYVFTGFKFVPLPDNQIYDGKLVAQYEKEPLKVRMLSVLNVLAWILIIGLVIGLITVLTISVFNPKKPQNREKAPRSESLVADTTTQSFADTTSLQGQDPTDISNDTLLPIAEEEAVAEDAAPTLESNDNLKFQQEFWELIHQRNVLMDSYDGLYKQYKGKVSGEEYDYLRFTILKDSPSYLEWSRKLRKMPTDELATIESVDVLKSKLKDIK